MLNESSVFNIEFPDLLLLFCLKTNKIHFSWSLFKMIERKVFVTIVKFKQFFSEAFCFRIYVRIAKNTCSLQLRCDVKNNMTIQHSGLSLRLNLNCFVDAVLCVNLERILFFEGCQYMTKIIISFSLLYIKVRNCGIVCE